MIQFRLIHPLPTVLLRPRSHPSTSMACGEQSLKACTKVQPCCLKSIPSCQGASAAASPAMASKPKLQVMWSKANLPSKSHSTVNIFLPLGRESSRKTLVEKKSKAHGNPCQTAARFLLFCTSYQAGNNSLAPSSDKSASLPPHVADSTINAPRHRHCPHRRVLAGRATPPG